MEHAGAGEENSMTTKSNLKFAITSEVFGPPVEEAIRRAAAIGFDGIEIAPFNVAPDVNDVNAARRAEIAQVAASSGIEVVGLHWLLAKPEGLSINHPDEIIRVRTQEYIEALIHFCADIGGKLLLHGSPHQRTIREGWDPALAWEHAKETFKVCLHAAQKRTVFYCIEPLTRTNTNFINTVEDGLRFVREIRHPHFKLMFDCRSASETEVSVVDALLRALDSRMLRHVHVNDANGRGPGFGQTPFVPILRTLVENNYEGYVSVEVFHFDPDPRTIASRSIGYLKGILEALAGC